MRQIRSTVLRLFIPLSRISKRLTYWLLLTGASVGGGIITDLMLKSGSFPIFVRSLGLVGMLSAHFLLKRSGRVLRILGKPEKDWGWTTHLITIDLYQCLRHPHHLGIGIFMTSLGLLIGHPWSFLFIALIQWTWVVGFLLLVEEKELMKKFGEAYKVYRQRVPMLFPNPSCVFKVLSKPIDLPEKQRKATDNAPN